jgi:ribosomal protein S27E
MGDRYFLEITCPKCGFYDDNVYYAPTCGFTKWTCPKCGFRIDLAEYTGISAEEASNKEEIETIIKNYINIPAKKPKKGYWYHFLHTECVLCGAGETFKERVYDKPRPTNYEERHEYEQFACEGHFM